MRNSWSTWISAARNTHVQRTRSFDSPPRLEEPTPPLGGLEVKDILNEQEADSIALSIVRDLTDAGLDINDLCWDITEVIAKNLARRDPCGVCGQLTKRRDLIDGCCSTCKQLA